MSSHEVCAVWAKALDVPVRIVDSVAFAVYALFFSLACFLFHDVLLRCEFYVLRISEAHFTSGYQTISLCAKVLSRLSRPGEDVDVDDSNTCG